MRFFEYSYTASQATFLDYLKTIGVVLDTVILDINELPGDVYAVSKDAAKAGMQILSERFNAEMQTRNPVINEVFDIQVDPNEELLGKKMDFDDFIGEGYDFQSSKINLFRYDPDTLVIYHIAKKGFAKALLNPPYNLKFKRPDEFASPIYIDGENRFYAEIIKRYLAEILHVEQLSDADFLEIISWSDNWTNYFDDGKEWWGTFCWTIHDMRNNTITLIAASSTD